MTLKLRNNLNTSVLMDDLDHIHKNVNKKFFFNKTIFITGYMGFVGFELSKYFIHYFKDLKIKRLYLMDIKNDKNKIFNKKVIKIKKDITKINLDKFFKNKNINIIIHAASIASPYFYRKHPLKTIESNIVGLQKILNFSKNKKTIDRILYFSSSEIYGDPDKKNIPTNELYNGNVSCLGPRACYDEAKRMGETLCYVFNKEFNLQTRIVRPFNNYGPGLNIYDKRLPADLANNILNNKNITIFSDGSPTRSFCYISDAIIGYLNILVYKKFCAVNIGNDAEEISVRKFSEKFYMIGKKYLKYNGKILYKKNREKEYLINNPKRRCPNINLARKIIKFKPKIKLRDGIEKYLKFLKYET